MTIGEKIFFLREEKDISQDELAEMLGVSWRQVSSWERGDTVPEIDKIVKLSEVFGVSTDALIKDGIDPGTDNTAHPKKEKRTLPLSEVSDFLTAKSKAAKLIAAATFLIMLSVGIMLIIFNIPSIVRTLAVAIGISLLIITVAVSVGIYIRAYYVTSKYDYIVKGDFTLAYNTYAYIEDTEKKSTQVYTVRSIAATVISIISVIPLIATSIIASGQQLYIMISLAVTLLIAGVGVSMFIISGVERSAIASLKETRSAQVGYSKRLEDSIESTFWTIVVAAYLLYSFKSGNWDKSWIVFIFAAAISGLISTVFSLVRKASGADSDNTDEDDD